MNLPVSFGALAKTAKNPASGGYPLQLKGSDLDRNFEYACANFSNSFVVEINNNTRTVSLANPIPTPPSSGTHVLGVVGGVLTWIATEEC